MKKKLVSIVVALFLVVASFATLTGCGNKETTIEVLLLANNNETEFYAAYFDEMEEILKEETGIDYEIKFTGLQEKPYQEKLMSNIQSNNTPDIFYVRPNDILQYKAIIAPLQDYADKQEEVDLSTIYDVALDMYRYNAKTGALGNKEDPLYAFPKDLSTQQLGYNKVLLKKAEGAIRDAGYVMPWELGKGENPVTYTWKEFKGICEIVRDAKEKDEFVMDVPDLEVLINAFAGENENHSILDLSGGRANGKVASLTTGPVKKALDFQAELIKDGISTSGEGYASYANFTKGIVYFYGAIGSWEVGEYNDYFGKNYPDAKEDTWGLMPWPVENKGDTWKGVITSAGYAVSKKCANSKKGDIAKRIALSFLSKGTQEQLVKDKKISLPLIKNNKADYIDSKNDNIYSPSTRSIFMDVISGEHGFFPAKYSTYNTDWLDPLDIELDKMYKEGNNADKYLTQTKLEKIQSDMQSQYDRNKNK